MVLKKLKRRIKAAKAKSLGMDQVFLVNQQQGNVRRNRRRGGRNVEFANC